MAALYNLDQSSIDSEEYKALKSAVQHINKKLQQRFESNEILTSSPQIGERKSSISSILRESNVISYSNNSTKYKKVPKKSPVHLELSTDLEWNQDRYGFAGKFSTRTKKGDLVKDPYRPNTSTHYLQASKAKPQITPSLIFEKPGDQYMSYLRQETKIQPTVLLNSRLNTEVSFPHKPYRSNSKPPLSSNKEPSKELKSFMELKKATSAEIRDTPKIAVEQTKDKDIRNKNRSMNSSKMDLTKTLIVCPTRVDSAVLKKKPTLIAGENTIFMPKKNSISSANKLIPTNHLLKDSKEPKEDIFEQIRKAQKLSQITEGVIILSPEEKHQSLLAKARLHLNKKKEQISTSSNLFKPLIPVSRATPFRQYQH